MKTLKQIPISIIVLTLMLITNSATFSQTAEIVPPLPVQNASLPIESFPESTQLPQYGIASWYSQSDRHIRRHTANGEIFDDSELTCASWDYAFGTYLKVTNLENGKSLVCRVNDRGPAKRLERLIDLTKSGFQLIDDLKRGIIRVSVVRIKVSS